MPTSEGPSQDRSLSRVTGPEATDLQPFDVVVVPFPFTDRKASKRRPALVVSRAEALGDRIGHSVMAMITSADTPPWPLDTPVTGLSGAGLRAPSVVRMKLFTLDHRLVIRRAGALSPADRESVRRRLEELLPVG